MESQIKPNKTNVNSKGKEKNSKKSRNDTLENQFNLNKYGWERYRKLKEEEEENNIRSAAMEFAEVCTTIKSSTSNITASTSKNEELVEDNRINTIDEQVDDMKCNKSHKTPSPINCQNCQILSKESADLKGQFQENFKIIKKKMFSTSELIKEFHQKGQELEECRRKLKDTSTRLEKAYNETGNIRLKLEKALQANVPYKRAIKRMENEKSLSESEVQHCKERLKKAEDHLKSLRSQITNQTIDNNDVQRQKTESVKLLDKEKLKVLKQASTIDKLTKKLTDTRAQKRTQKKLITFLTRENEKLKNALEMAKAGVSRKSTGARSKKPPPDGILSPSPSPPPTPISSFPSSRRKRVKREVDRDGQKDSGKTHEAKEVRFQLPCTDENFESEDKATPQERQQQRFMTSNDEDMWTGITDDLDNSDSDSEVEHDKYEELRQKLTKYLGPKSKSDRFHRFDDFAVSPPLSPIPPSPLPWRGETNKSGGEQSTAGEQSLSSRLDDSLFGDVSDDSDNENDGDDDFDDDVQDDVIRGEDIKESDDVVVEDVLEKLLQNVCGSPEEILKENNTSAKIILNVPSSRDIGQQNDELVRTKTTTEEEDRYVTLRDTPVRIDSALKIDKETNELTSDAHQNAPTDDHIEEEQSASIINRQNIDREVDTTSDSPSGSQQTKNTSPIKQMECNISNEEESDHDKVTHKTMSPDNEAECRGKQKSTTDNENNHSSTEIHVNKLNEVVDQRQRKPSISEIFMMTTGTNVTSHPTQNSDSSRIFQEKDSLSPTIDDNASVVSHNTISPFDQEEESFSEETTALSSVNKETSPSQHTEPIDRSSVSSENGNDNVTENNQIDQAASSLEPIAKETLKNEPISEEQKLAQETDECFLSTQDCQLKINNTPVTLISHDNETEKPGPSSRSQQDISVNLKQNTGDVHPKGCTENNKLVSSPGTSDLTRLNSNKSCEGQSSDNNGILTSSSFVRANRTEDIKKSTVASKLARVLSTDENDTEVAELELTASNPMSTSSSAISTSPLQLTQDKQSRIQPVAYQVITTTSIVSVATTLSPQHSRSIENSLKMITTSPNPVISPITNPTFSNQPRQTIARRHSMFSRESVIPKMRSERRHTYSPIMSISPPLSPIPPSPRRNVLTPLISPLPTTPLLDSISPLPPSPKITSPPLIRGSALVQSENLSVRMPVPVAHKRTSAVQAITFTKQRNTRSIRETRSTHPVTTLESGSADAISSIHCIEEPKKLLKRTRSAFSLQQASHNSDNNVSTLETENDQSEGSSHRKVDMHTEVKKPTEQNPKPSVKRSGTPPQSDVVAKRLKSNDSSKPICNETSIESKTDKKMDEKLIDIQKNEIENKLNNFDTKENESGCKKTLIPESQSIQTFDSSSAQQSKPTTGVHKQLVKRTSRVANQSGPPFKTKADDISKTDDKLIDKQNNGIENKLKHSDTKENESGSNDTSVQTFDGSSAQSKPTPLPYQQPVKRISRLSNQRGPPLQIRTNGLSSQLTPPVTRKLPVRRSDGSSTQTKPVKTNKLPVQSFNAISQIKESLPKSHKQPVRRSDSSSIQSRPAFEDRKSVVVDSRVVNEGSVSMITGDSDVALLPNDAERDTTPQVRKVSSCKKPPTEDGVTKRRKLDTTEISTNNSAPVEELTRVLKHSRKRKQKGMIDKRLLKFCRSKNEMEKNYVIRILDKFSKTKTLKRDDIVKLFRKPKNVSSARNVAFGLVHFARSCNEILLIKCLEDGDKKEMRRKRTSSLDNILRINRFNICHPGLEDIQTPLLTKIESDMMWILRNLKSTVCSGKAAKEILKTIRQTLFFSTPLLVFEVHSLCRLYASVCRLFDLLDDLVLFLYTVAFDQFQHLNFASVFLTCYTTWPSVVLRSDLLSLQSNNRWFKVKLSPLSASMIFLALQSSLLEKQNTNLKLMEKLFVGTLENTFDANEYLKEITEEIYSLLKNDELSLLEGDDDNGYELNTYAFSCVQALLLLCRKLGWEYTHNVMITEMIWNDLKMFLQADGDSKKAALLLVVIGHLCRCGTASGFSNFQDMVDLMSSLLTCGGLLMIEYAVCYVLLEILPHSPDHCRKALHSWNVRLKQQNLNLPISLQGQLNKLL